MKVRIGTLRNSVLGVVLCGAIAPAMAQEASAPVDPASRSIYQSLELGFKLCSNHILRRGHLSSDHTQMLDGMGVTLVDTVPENIALNTGPLFAQDPIFAKVSSAEGQVYISTARETIACRVIVADTADALQPRIEFVDALRKTSSWTYDTRRSGMQGGMMREELTAAGGRLVAIMNGPNTVIDDSKGIQAFLTVAVIPPPTR